MTADKRDKPAVTAYPDHDVIVPKNPLRKAWLKPSAAAGDPVAAAEQALAALSGEFASWMQSECSRLEAARQRIHSEGLSADAVQALFHAAHDIKGEAATFGFPLAAAAAKSLCRLIERTVDLRRIPLLLVDQHVDAVRAIVREHDKLAAEQIAQALTARLRDVTDNFLLAETGSKDDEEVASPPTVPTPPST